MAQGRKQCEFYYWGDFVNEVLEYMFPTADRIVLKEEGNYDFTVVVYDEDGDSLTYTSTEIEKEWYKIDDTVSVYDMHVDHQGIWVVFE